MIFTVTFNPSLDYIVGLKSFNEGQVNRSDWEEIYAGGKGINVSMVLKNLGISSIALGFIGGFTGAEIQKRVKDFGCSADFVEIESGISRINVKIRASKESEINGQGPHISDQERELLFKKLDQLESGDYLVLAGSIPVSLPVNTYEVIMEKLENKGIRIVVDATGELLKKVLKFRPFLIKPNKQELEEIFNTVIKTREDIIIYGKRLQELGARNVLISMAGEGAILIDEKDNIHQMAAPKGTVVNSVGAGDSMVAGFIAGYQENEDYDEAFKTGIATGSASAFSKQLATRDEVERVFKMLN